MEQDEREKKRGFRFVLAVVFLDMLGIGIAVPVLPLLVGDFVKSPDEQALWYGVLASVFGLMQFFCMPLLGALSDKIGRRPVLIFSSAGMAVNFLATAWAPSLAWMFLGRVIGGACSASMSTASAYASDISTPATRAKYFGMIGAAFGVGFICGPMFGGFLGSINYHLPFYVGAGLCAANAVFGYLFVKESLPAEKRNVFTWAKANPFASLFRLFARKDIGALIVVFGLASLAQYLMHGTWVLYTHFKFGWGPKENGIALFFVGLTAAVVQAVLLSRMLKKFGEIRLSLIGFWTGTLVYVGYGLATEGWMFYLLIVCNLFAFASGPAMQAIISKATDPREQGALMGSLQSLGSLAIVAGTLIGTNIFATVSHYPQGDWRMGAPFFASALLLGTGWLIARGFFARHGSPVHPANHHPAPADAPAKA
ncbi:MAG: TCR/Tet family MFS transporter [Betaproteobacteria bacterium]|nr:TCR/Tet family MFS transporter [Betaproteobacteria bacterium]